MRLIIDIPKRVYDATKTMGNVIDADNEIVAKAIANGTPISDNATNGDMPCVTPEEMQKCKDIVKKYKPTGKWLDVDGIWFKCSESGAHRKMFPAYKEYFCPNCGADMRTKD